MGIFNRLSALFKSNANAALDSMSNPAKEFDLLIIEMEEQIRKAREEVVRNKGIEKLAAARVVKLEKDLETWRAREQQATRAGEADLTVEVQARIADLERELVTLKIEQREAAAFAAAQQASLPRAEARLKQIRARRGTIHAKLSQSDQQQASMDALAEFSRLGDRIDANEATQGAAQEVEESLRGEQSARALEDKLAALNASGSPGSEANRRLEELKAKMKKDPG